MALSFFYSRKLQGILWKKYKPNLQKGDKNMKELVITADGLIVTREEFIDLMRNGK